MSSIVNKPGLGAGDRDMSPEGYEEIESYRQKSRGRDQQKSNQIDLFDY